MAKSRYEYVKDFERDDRILLNTWFVVRVDGKGFTKLTKELGFTKPNDVRGLDLMNAAGIAVAKEFPEIILGYGESDEFSFLFHRDAKIYKRRESKIISQVASVFTGAYVFHWSEFFPNDPLPRPPVFDARAVLYPTKANVRDYFAWRQADCHVNNLYNTVFWALVDGGGMTGREAHERLNGTLSGEKNEILFSEFGINYNDEPPMFKKGSVLMRRVVEEAPTVEQDQAGPSVTATDGGGDAGEEAPPPAATAGRKMRKRKKPKTRWGIGHEDIIGHSFWRTTGLLDTNDADDDDDDDDGDDAVSDEGAGST